MRKGSDGGKKRGKKRIKKRKKRRMKIVATTSLAAVDRPKGRPLERTTLAPKVFRIFIRLPKNYNFGYIFFLIRTLVLIPF